MNHMQKKKKKELVDYNKYQIVLGVKWDNKSVSDKFSILIVFSKL